MNRAERELRDCIAELEIMDRQLKDVTFQNHFDNSLVKLVNDYMFPTLNRLKELQRYLSEWNEQVAIIAQNKFHEREIARVKAEAETNCKFLVAIKDETIRILKKQAQEIIDSNPPSTTDWGAWWRKIPMEEREGYIKGLYQADQLIELEEKIK